MFCPPETVDYGTMMTLPTPDPLPRDIVTIVMAEDDAGDAGLVAMAYRSMDVQLIHASTGRDCIAALEAAEPPPAMVLLDFNLPDMRGIDILRFIRGHARLQDTPVVMLSGSDADKDLREAFTDGANAYIVKSSDIDDLFGQLRAATDRFC